MFAVFTSFFSLEQPRVNNDTENLPPKKAGKKKKKASKKKRSTGSLQDTSHSSSRLSPSERDSVDNADINSDSDSENEVEVTTKSEPISAIASLDLQTARIGIIV